MNKLSYLIFGSIITSMFCFSQQDLIPLKFDTKYYNAIDKWVAFPKTEKDSTYTLGFIYIDEMAGFTFNFENSFTIKNNILIPAKKDSILNTTSLKSRLSTNTKNVAIINEEQIKELNLPSTPAWLEIYKNNEDSVEYLKQIGYHYNHIGASTNAIEPLLKAYNKQPHYKGLEFELAFAFNATKQFKKAIPVLEKAIANKNNDQLIYKELGYALMNIEEYDKAENAFNEGIKNAKDNNIKVEMAINMCSLYFNNKNEKKYNKWIKIAKQYIDETSQFSKYIDYFESEWQKQKKH
ncbi:tetratricopeptide repeat protein [Winogradskyella endarachnes]|uniref:Uncharacterized protein n=1 Tax=Winogradskyella endarachnes TaxID=2681965 RepID=A0A6L6UFH8_9FLAO|nr:hypothetical protein [Winogradskyella endarachnes]MUU79722.1 hypothetical protein [Winogradskyella endarachnes]